jgi:hypothetical protein
MTSTGLSSRKTDERALNKTKNPRRLLLLSAAEGGRRRLPANRESKTQTAHPRNI